MKATFFNTSLRPLKTVARIALPPSFSDNVHFTDANGDVTKLSKLMSIGTVGNIFTLKGNFNPGPLEGTISEGVTPASDFVFSNWVGKDPMGSILTVVVTLSTGQTIRLPMSNASRLLHFNQDQAVFEIVSNVISGFKATQYLTINNDLDHVDFKIAVNWADRNNPSYQIAISKIEIESKDKFVVHFRQQMGLPLLIYQPWIDTWKLTVQNQSVIRDGQGFELRGYILTNPDFIPTITPEIQARLDNLKAVEEGLEFWGGVGEVNGVCENSNKDNTWFYRYLPQKINLPNLQFPHYFVEPSLYSTRWKGMTKTPFQTGNQEDFGADKGLEATVWQKPFWLTYIKGALTESMRWFNIHELNGAPVVKENHPTRVTWSMETFDPLTQDTLGKTKWAPRDSGNGFAGYDNQHRSMNNVLTYYALTGDELVLNRLINVLETDIQQARNQALADREVGRMFACWAKMIAVMPPYFSNRLRAHCLNKLAEVKQDFKNQGPVKALQVIQDPRSNIINPANGNIEPAVIPYQTAEMVKGLYAYWLITNNEDAYELCKAFAKTVLWYGCFQEDGRWYTCVFLRFNNGQPISQYSTTSWELVAEGGGLWDWMAPAIGIANEILPLIEDRERAQEILEALYPDGATNLEQLSWFCTPISG